LNNVQFNQEKLNMQMVLVENLALTFVGDAHALAAGFAKILIRIVTLPIERVVHAVMAPIERIARASDVAGVYAKRQAERRKCLLDRLNPFRGLRHLT
jgi:uncharacterized protein (DUF2384 family)